MGIIINGVRLIKPLYDYVLQTVPKIDTRGLQKNMEDFVKDCFMTLKPLSHEHREVCYLDSYTLCLGEWIRIKFGGQRYGSYLNSSDSFFKYIREYGDRLKPWVRKPIKMEFCELVDLAKALRPYDDILIKLDIPRTEVFEYYCHTSRRGDNDQRIKISSMTINAIGIRTSYPWILLLYKEGEGEPEHREISGESKISIFEDIISYIVKLFKMADQQISAVREHNEKVMEKMSSTVKPWKIANNLKENES
ncbi:MAG: hypothetical protein ACP5KV_04175 [Candidatus Methanomethylicaceae archaeon]